MQADSTKSSSGSELLKWLFCLALLIPVFILYTSHYSSANPTGFILYDMPYYMANAREYFDRGSFNLFYSNPFSSFINSSRIYFQPQILILALLWKITAFDPGTVYCLFGFIAGIICLRLALLVYETLHGFESFTDKLVFIIFCWGGGALFISGLTYQLFHGNPIPAAICHAFCLDPANGFWMLSFGRNLVYPLEAYYHAVYFALIYTLFKEKFAVSALLMLLLSFSHPFTGLEIVSSVLLYQLIERFYLKNRNIPFFYIALTFVILLIHLGYYLLFLNMDAEYHSLYQQWSLPWTYRAENFIPAYIFVAGLVLFRLRDPAKMRAVFQKSDNRLLAVLAFTAFLLANHEFAISPKQPLHFTHGYIWIPLFLLGVPALKKLLRTLNARKMLRIALIVVVSLFFLLDNIMWFGLNSWWQHKGFGFGCSPQEKEVFAWINQNNINRDYLLLTNNSNIGYLSTVYTPARSFISHWSNTPFVNQKRKIQSWFFNKGVIHKALAGERLLVVYDEKSPTPPKFAAKLKFKKIFDNHKFSIYVQKNAYISKHR